MNIKQNKFKDFVTKIGIQMNSDLETGTIEEIVIQREAGIWNFIVGFESVLPFETYLMLDQTIKNTMKNLQGIQDVVILYQYKDKQIDPENLEKYYSYFYEDACLAKRTVLVCEERNMKFDTNKIIAYV